MFFIAGATGHWLVAQTLDEVFGEEPPLLKIDKPQDGAVVVEHEVAIGTTPYNGRNHYLLVMPLETGGRFIQGPMNLPGDDSWSGRAIFGEGPLGCDEAFLLSVIATRQTLVPGPAPYVPGDWLTSLQIKVGRDDC